MKPLVLGALLAVAPAAGLLSGCGGAPAAPATAERSREAPAADAFCVEHGVLEAVCTRCNPRLAAIFQERGDWCTEHEYPESFCPRCHPERGGRPAVDLEPDAPADGTRVQLASAETARQAGIETAQASEGQSSRQVEALGTIAYDPSRRAEVNARAPGIVREILFEVGQRVERGAPLLRIESAEVGAAQARRLAADSRVAVARAAHERAQALLDAGMGAQKDVDLARLELDTALAEQAAAESALAVVGVEGPEGSLYTLSAPLAGTCIARSVTIGRRVGDEEPLCEIVDTGVMWAELDVPESELLRVQPGQQVVVSADALGEHEFRGAIDSVAPEIDRATRTAKVRVRLENPQGLLRANLFVRARILLAREEVRVLVPRSAVQRAREAQLVFVELEPARYEARRVVTAAARGDRIELLAGVRPGERVVTQGSFLLKTETLKGEIGAGCCAED
ncbi:MAG TPA: efflux RND transporter periplasmic adaptor subunit [Planctomycetota bacterium]|nr:efflux RND transporter periplasmic adaptor subunit [Planctomycetota bacterium]